MGTTCTEGATSSSHAVSSSRKGGERIRNARSGFLRHPQCQLVSVILNISFWLSEQDAYILLQVFTRRVILGMGLPL